MSTFHSPRLHSAALIVLALGCGRVKSAGSAPKGTKLLSTVVGGSEGTSVLSGTGLGGACSVGPAGVVMIHRLNRTEYDNTVHDLLGTTASLAKAFPADNVGADFDNQADLLTVAPALIDNYLAAAETLGTEAALKTKPTTVNGIAFPALIACTLSATDQTCAAQTITNLASKAYRKPATSADVAALTQVYKGAMQEGLAPEAAMSWVVQALLISPRFLYRMEGIDDGQASTPGVHLVNDYELASRLAYFLWSTMPDQALFDAAKAGHLKDDAGLTEQVERMLNDPRAQALVDNFASQWLPVRALDTRESDRGVFPAYSPTLKASMQSETRLFVQAILHDNRSIKDLVQSDFTFVNEDLAKLYGLAGVTGSDLRRVSLAGTKRGGILTQATFLTATSSPTSTTPVKRGKWVLTELLCSSPPPPPANATTLAGKVDTTASKRVQMAQHRALPQCAACHAAMDPIGLGLENFNGIGAWQTTEVGGAIDPSGQLPGGASFAGPTELVTMLADKPEFVSCFSSKLTSYALGRVAAAGDQCAAAAITTAAQPGDYRLRDLIQKIVLSELFRKRVAEESN